MGLSNQARQLRMGGDYRNHLLVQIELLRGDISHGELSERLGDVTERCLARYIAGKSHLTESEFRDVAKALSIDPQVLARAWGSSLSLRASSKDAVSWMVSRAHQRWRQHSRIADRGVPSHPSPMAVIRTKYADRLPLQTPPLWFGSYRRCEEESDTPANRARFARAYEMLVESVHGGLSARAIGALHGISGERARQLMVFAAYTWARRERIDLSGKQIPFKNEARFIKDLYAGLKFFAQQQFNHLAVQALMNGHITKGDQTPVKSPRNTAAYERYRQQHARCLGMAVEEMRTAKNLTRSEVAKEANVSVRWIQRLETNKLHTNYTIGRLDRVARAIGVELYDFYKRAGEMAGPPPWLETEGIHNDE